MKQYWLLAILFFTTDSSNYAQDHKYFFYNPENDFGSDLCFNPMTLVINGSFDILRNGRKNKDVLAIAYKNGFENVFRNISRPAHNLKIFGWKKFVRHEIWNFSLDMNSLQFIPNYSHHLIGNGMQYVLLAEWYDYHRVKAPYLCSLVTTTIYQILNEAIENGAYKGTTVDPISDLLIFNPLGILLFSTNFAKKFFSETLSIHDWSLQPVLDPRNHFLENAGQQFVIKSKKVFANHYSVFFYWGIDGIVGISYNYKTMHNFSFGVGTVVNNLKEKRLKWSRVLTPEVDGAIGLFYDRNNSLMSSIIITCPRLYNARINIYPGLLGKKWFIPGFYVGFGEWDKFVFGLTSVYSPVGLAHRVK